MEIDLIVEQAGKVKFICEIKSTRRSDERHCRALQIFSGDFPEATPILITQDESKKKYGNVLALEWKEALDVICE